MATNLIRHLPKSYRQSPLGVKLQPVRNTSSGASPTQPPATQQSPINANSMGTTIGNMKLAVGLSLGLSVGLAIQSQVIDRLFPQPKPEPPRKPEPSFATDPKLLDHIISQDRKQTQLAMELASMKDKLIELPQSSYPPTRSNGNVFELSEVIQANNLASEARHKRDLEEQQKTIVREHLLKVEGEILKVENKYRPTINKIRELEVHLDNQRQMQQKEAPARLLWLSCQQLMIRLRDAPQQPLEKDPAYKVLKQFAENDNQLAMSVLDSIPAVILKNGVQSEETLTERFQKLEKACKRVALVDSSGAGLGKYILSYLQSLFIIDRDQISEAEITGQQLVDPTKWTTFDILARVRYCLGRRNLEQAIRYANQLKGQARVVARDWIRDARLHLLTRQALSAIMTHAEAIGLETAQSVNWDSN